jgi:hypothetical protein
MIRTGFVRDSHGVYWLQIPDDSVWGFALMADDGITYPGGFNIGTEWWEYVKAEEVPLEVREQFEWYTKEHPVE